MIILALDSAELSIIERYNLPFLGQLLKNVCRIEGPHHLSEMGAWTTLWSGIPAVRHGYYCIRRIVPGEYRLEPSNRPVIPCPPFWRDWPGSISIWDAQEFDAEPSYGGEQLCNWRTSWSDRCEPQASSHPVSLLPEVERRYGPRSRPQAFNEHDTPQSRRRYYELSRERIRTCGKLFQDVLARRDHDLYILGCAELHSAGHLCWTYDAEGEQRMKQLHEDLDHELERACNGVKGPIVVVSAYGIEPAYPASDVTEQLLRGLGYQQSQPPSTSWIPSRVRQKISEWMPAGMQEESLNRNLLHGSDWSRTTAFSMTALYTGHIRINLKGREPQGIVEPGRDYDETVARIIADVQQLESPIPEKIRAIAPLAGEIPTHLPDIMISWQERSEPWDRLVHPRFQAPIPRHRHHRSTYHSYRGFLASRDFALPEVMDIPEVAAFLRKLAP